MLLVTQAEYPTVLPQQAASDLDALCKGAREFAWNGQVGADAFGASQARKTWAEVHEHVRACLDDADLGNGAWQRSLQFVFKHREDVVGHILQRVLNETFLMANPGPWAKLQICAFIAQGASYENIAWRTGQPVDFIHAVHDDEELGLFTVYLERHCVSDAWRKDFAAVEEAFFKFRQKDYTDFEPEPERWNPPAAIDLPEYREVTS